MHRLLVSLPLDAVDALRQATSATQESLSSYIRRAVVRQLQADHPQPAMAGESISTRQEGRPDA